MGVTWARVVDNELQSEAFELNQLRQDMSSKLSELAENENKAKAVTLDYRLVNIILENCQSIQSGGLKLRMQLGKLEAYGKMLGTLLNGLFAGECVESASTDINRIIAEYGADPSSVLNRRLALTAEDTKALVNHYKTLTKKGIETQGNDNTIQLPTEFVKANFQDIATLEEESWVLFLLFLPVEYYTDFFEAVVFEGSQVTKDSLFQALENGFFQPEQVEAIFVALIQHNQLWGGLRKLLEGAVAIGKKATELVLVAFDGDGARVDAVLQEGEDGQTVLHSAVKNSESLQVILGLFPNDKTRIYAVFWDGETALHYAAYFPKSLQVILDLYLSDEARLNAILKEDSNVRTVLHYATENPESLEVILSSLSSDSAKIAFYMVLELSGKNHERPASVSAEIFEQEGIKYLLLMIEYVCQLNWSTYCNNQKPSNDPNDKPREVEEIRELIASGNLSEPSKTGELLKTIQKIVGNKSKEGCTEFFEKRNGPAQKFQDILSNLDKTSSMRAMKGLQSIMREFFPKETEFCILQVYLERQEKVEQAPVPAPASSLSSHSV